MTVALTPLKWDAALNPEDQVDYTIDLVGRLLEVGETVQSYTLTPSDTSVAAGLLIGSGPYASALGSITNGIFTAGSGTVLRIWFSINSTNQANVGFFGTGVWLDMQLKVVTTNTPPRTRERTLLLRVCQQ
jgi:hypothetical protein